MPPKVAHVAGALLVTLASPAVAFWRLPCAALVTRLNITLFGN